MPKREWNKKSLFLFHYKKKAATKDSLIELRYRLFLAPYERLQHSIVLQSLAHLCPVYHGAWSVVNKHQRTAYSRVVDI